MISEELKAELRREIRGLITRVEKMEKELGEMKEEIINNIQSNG